MVSTPSCKVMSTSSSFTPGNSALTTISPSSRGGRRQQGDEPTRWAPVLVEHPVHLALHVVKTTVRSHGHLDYLLALSGSYREPPLQTAQTLYPALQSINNFQTNSCVFLQVVFRIC